MMQASVLNKLAEEAERGVQNYSLFLLLGWTLVTKLQSCPLIVQVTKLTTSRCGSAHLFAFRGTEHLGGWFPHLLTLGPERINSWYILPECFIRMQICRLLILTSSLLKTINHVGQKITVATSRDWNFQVLHNERGVSSSLIPDFKDACERGPSKKIY